MQNQPDDNSPGVISTRTMEIVVALVLMVLAAIVIQDSLRLGAGWAENEGPRAGYFPFYIGLLLGLASLVTLVQAVRAGMRAKAGTSEDDAEPFVTKEALKRVLLVLGPVVVFIFALGFIGIYVSAALYITAFMMYFGRYRPHTGLAVGIAIALALFFMFEVWFLVPLPKGPLEDMLGY